MLIPKISGSFALTNAGSPAVTTLTLYSNANHNLQAGDHFWIYIPTGATKYLVGSQELVVSSVTDETHFTATTSTLSSESYRAITIYPLVAPPLTRSAKVAMPASKFDMASTNSQLVQTPLDSPTVFNYFYPDYKYPGAMAAANLTTPEFELTTDTNIVTLTNSLSSMILTSSDTSGLSNFVNGSLMFDLGPYMTSPNSVADTKGVTALVDKLGDVLAGGQLTAQTKTAIINYVANTTNFPTTSSTYVRDRVRAIVHMILISPEYAVQR